MRCIIVWFFFFSSRRRHTRLQGDWSSDVCSSDLIAGFENHPYPFENSLVAIAQVSADARSDSRMPANDALAVEVTRARTFASEFPGRRQRVRRYLDDLRKTRGKIALFGAGHLACTFVILFGIAD